jgi:hypothetical protein
MSKRGEVMAKEKLDKMGAGFDDDYIGPLDVGPSKGQEGWTPSNPELPEPSDPLGYIPGDKK